MSRNMTGLISFSPTHKRQQGSSISIVYKMLCYHEVQPDLSNWAYKGFRSTHYKSHNVQKRFELKEKKKYSRNIKFSQTKKRHLWFTAGHLHNMIRCSAASVGPALFAVIVNVCVRVEDIIYTLHFKETQHHH